MRLRPVHLDRLDRAAILRLAAPTCRTFRAGLRCSRWIRKAWPALKQKLAEVFKTKTRDEWCAIMEGTDVCFAPVLTMREAPEHPHMAAREVFVTRHGVTQPAPAPRFSRTPSAIREAAKVDIAELTSEWKAAG